MIYEKKIIFLITNLTIPVQHDRREVLREFPINILPQDMPYGTSNASIEHFLCRSMGGYGYDIICEFSYNTIPAFLQCCMSN